MYRVREADNTEQDRYDGFVAEHDGHACQSFAWGEIDRARGWSPVRLMVEDDSGRMAATAAGACKPVGGRWSVLDVPWGPALDATAADPESVIRALKGYARERRVIHLRVNPEIPADDGLGALLGSAGFSVTDTPWRYNETWRIDLRPTEDEILAKMEQSTRGNIRRAERAGCTISNANSDQDFAAFLELYREMSLWRDRSGHSDAQLQAVWSLPHLRQLFVGYQDGRPYHALLLYTFGRRVWQAYSASSGTIRSPGQCVNWAAIKWAKANGHQDCDLGGKPREPENSQTHNGIYRYKRGFGGEEVARLSEMAWSPNAAWDRAFWLVMAARGRLKRLFAHRGSSEG